MKRPPAIIVLLASILGAVIYLRRARHASPASPDMAPAIVDTPRGGPSTVELVGVHTQAEQQGVGSFAGRVTSSGAGVAGAELTFVHGEAVSTTTTTPTGDFVFRPTDAGSYELVGISKKGFLPFVPDEGAVRLEARPGRAVSGLLFQLTAESAITVEVQGDAPLAGAHVTVHTPGTLSVAGPRDAVTDDDGHAAIGAGEGDLVEVSLDGWEPATHRVTTADVRDARIRITLAHGSGELAQVTGTVIDEQSQPIDGAQLAILDGNALVGEALSGTDGTFALRAKSSAHLRVRATRAGFVPDEQPASNARLTLRLRRGCIVTGRVKDKSGGGGVPSFTVVVRRVSGQGDTPASPTSYDAEGRFEVRAITAGRYSMQVLAAGYAPSTTRIIEVSEACAPVEATFELGHGGTVYGRITDSKTGDPIVATVQLEGFVEGAGMDVHSSMTTDSSGTFEIGGLPAGRRSIVASAEGHHARIVAGIDVRDGDRTGPTDVALDAVQAGETARTQLTGIGAVLAPGDGVLTIQATMPGSGAEAAGLAKGDQLTAIDGNEIRNMGFEDATNAIRGPADTTVSLDVKKVNGKLVSLVVQRKIVR